jgi:hypothetical protein
MSSSSGCERERTSCEIPNLIINVICGLMNFFLLIKKIFQWCDNFLPSLSVCSRGTQN